MRGLVVLVRQHELLVEIGLDLRLVEVDVLLLRLRLGGEERQGIVVDLLESHWFFLLDQHIGGSEGVFERDLHVLFIVWVDEDVLAHGLAAAVFGLLRQFWNDGFKELVLQFEEEVEFPGVVYLAIDERIEPVEVLFAVGNDGCDAVVVLGVEALDFLGYGAHEG